MNEQAPPQSPLDPFLAQFLREVRMRDNGYQPGLETPGIAATLDVPQAFVNALFTSAQTRGLLKPIYGRASKIRWAVSTSGEILIDRLQHPSSRK